MKVTRESYHDLLASATALNERVAPGAAQRLEVMLDGAAVAGAPLKLTDIERLISELEWMDAQDLRSLLRYRLQLMVAEGCAS